jgi:NAD(P)-dependent dehydrogenase (short-subunit alcohol dehydrogenase family)
MTNLIQNDLTGKIALITGGTDGIGRQTAKGLAQRGASVVVVGRNATKGQATVELVRDAVPSAKIEFIQTDLSLMSEVRRLADEFRRRYDRLDVLIHSAGVILGKRELTAEGIEKTFAIDYLSRFLLTNLLLDLLKASVPSRVINIAAAGMTIGKLDFDDILGERKTGGMRALGQAQYANDVFTVELARRLRGTGIATSVLNPGGVDTDIRREMPRLLSFVMGMLMRPLIQTPQQGAEAPLLLATAPEYADVQGGLFQKFRKFKQIQPSAKISDPEQAKRLWEVSEQLTGLDKSSLVQAEKAVR